MRSFGYLTYSAFSMMLLCTLVLLPLAPALATFDVSVLEEVASDSNGETESIVRDVDETQDGNEEAISSEPVQIVEEKVDTDSLGVDGNAESTPSESESTHPDVTVSSKEIQIPDSTEDVAGTVPVIEDEESPTEDPLESQNEEDVVHEEPVSEDVTEGSEAADAGEVLGTVPNTTVNDSNKFSFSKDECVVVGNGSFYCAKGTEVPEVLNTDRIFSAPDEEGDKEIYVERSNELTMLTDNAVDDDAPYYDEISNTAVWHRLIDGRYQIIAYDFEKKEEEQITADRYNNMQPTRFNESLVWQGWVGDDWEIFLLRNDELTMITDNTNQDITPSVNGTHIVWQAFEGSAWRMKVYDINSKHIETIEDSDGGSIENPRFVLVYDTKFESGDVETRGYDLKSGEIVPLSSTPAPKEIPDPDQTGEERALVSPIVQPKPKTDDEIDDGTVPVDPEPEVNENDVVIPAYDETVESTGDEIVTPDPLSDTEHIPDVVVEPIVESESTNTPEHIIDVIITPFVEPIESTENTTKSIAN